MKKITLTFILSFLTYFSFGQQLYQYYTVFKRSVNYQHLTSGNEYFVNQDKDDNTIYDRPLGFTFNYNGQNYTTVNISTNGALRFGTYLAVDYNNDLASTSTTDIVAPLWDDLYIRAVDNGKIIYDIQGTAPNRKFIVEWRNISWRDAGSTVSFKAILYEHTNNIEFQYGPGNITDPHQTASIGLSQGTAGNNFISITPTNDYMTVSSATPDNNIDTNQYPGNGTTYEFKHLTYVPDDHLEQAMIGQGWDTILDNYVETYQIKHAVFFGPTDSQIADATGLEDMKMLKGLQLDQNNLTSLTNLDNRHLEGLYCDSNSSLAQIDVTRLPALKRLRVSWCQISQIDLTNNPDLTYLHIFDNELTSLNVTQNPLLEELVAGNNQLTSIDLSNNPNIKYLRISHNQLSALNVSNMPDLIDIYCSQNQIGVLDLTHNTQLRDVYVWGNQLESLDLTATQNAVGVQGLRRVNAHNNPPLERVLLANGHNSNLEDVDLTTCPLLYCVSVDDPVAANNGTGVYQNFDIDQTMSHYSGPGGCPELVTIPDANFEAYLENNGMGDGISNNHRVEKQNIENVQTLFLSNQNISDLTGIEDFTALVTLHCDHNHLTQIDVSHNQNLQNLYCHSNPLVSLTTGGLPNLITLDAHSSSLSNIDVSQNQALRTLNLNQTNISYLDLRGQTSLLSLTVSNSLLSDILLTNAPNLKFLTLSDNQLTHLDLDQNPRLERLDLRNNDLSDLHIQNGANALLSGTYTSGGVSVSKFRATGNPNLTCIYVDNATDANNGTGDYQDWEKDNTATYVQSTADCQALTQTTYVPDDHFEHYLETHDANGNVVAVGDPNSLGNGTDYDDYVYTDRISGVTSLTMFRRNISDLTGIEDFTALTNLDCHENFITHLNLSNNTNLVTLNAHNNQLTSVSLNNNQLLESLSLYHNNLNNIDLSHLTGLKYLYLGQNQLTSLDLSHNSGLLNIDVSDNSLSVLDLSRQYDIANIVCSNNQITDLIISEGYYEQSDLMYLYADHNQIRELDVSGLETLEEIDLSNNALVICNVANGNNTNFGEFNLTNNPSLSCVEVDDATYMQNNWGNAIDSGASYSENCHVNETYVPDDNFEHYLETHDASGNTVAVGDANSMGNGTDNDDYVKTSRIQNVSVLGIQGQNIADLTGIEDFTALSYLACYNNQLTDLDLSHNLSLAGLYAHNNHLTSLNVSSNTSLSTLWCQLNNLTTLDITHNNALIVLNCGNNHLTSINVAQNTQLEELNCYGNQIASIDVSSNPALKKLWVSYNQLSSIDLDDNYFVEKLWCDHNDNLSELRLQNGANNLLSGTFTVGSTTYSRMIASNNPNLTCIYVDNATDANNGSGDYQDWDVDATATYVASDAECNALNNYDLTVNTTGNGSVALSPAGGNYAPGTSVTLTATANTGWEFAGWSGDLTGTTNPATITMDSDKTVTATFSQIPQTYVPDDNFENYLETHDAGGNTVAVGDPNSMGNGVANDDHVTTANINTVTTLDIQSMNISDLTGIEDFTALTVLFCNDNQLTSLDVTHNINLTELECFNNQLTSLNITQCTNLTSLICDNNQLTGLDISHNTNLTSLDCDDNQLTNLDVSQNTNLISIRCDGNQLTGLDVSQNINLTALYCFNNQLTDLDVSQNTNLNVLYCYNNQLTGLDISQNTNLTEFECNNNQLTNLDVSQNTNLTKFKCNNNQLTNLDVSQNINLTQFECNNNQLTDLDVSQNINLNWFFCNNNQLTGLNVKNGHNTAITYFDATNNPNLTCIQVDDAAWSTVNWTNIDATASFSEDCSIVYYSLTVNTTGNGSVSPASGTYAEGTVLSLTAIPDVGWEFAGWSGDLTGMTNPATITMDSDKTVTATFTRIQHTLSVNTSGNGNVALSPAGGTYNEGTTVTLTATPDAGWEFAGWSGDLTGTSNPATITMDSDKTVMATFSQQAQTYVPDDNFEAYLEANGMGNGVANDDHVTTANINTVTGLDVSGLNIADLTGIEDFVSLTDLNCSNNNLTSIDLSNLTHLQNLDVNGNQLSALDVSHNTILVYLSAYENQISALDVSANTDLSFLVIFNNQISAIDVSGLANLQGLICNDNQISDIDVSNNHSLQYLWVHNNQLTGLNVQNGANGLMAGTFVEPGGATVSRFRATGNPDLTCIFVDDATAATAGTGDYLDWDIDATSHFVETQAECDALGITNLDLKNSLKVYPNPVNNILHIQSDFSDEIDIHIYNLVGQELIHKTINNQQTDIELNELPAANYLIKIVVSKRSVYYNIIKE